MDFLLSLFIWFLMMLPVAGLLVLSWTQSTPEMRRKLNRLLFGE